MKAKPFSLGLVGTIAASCLLGGAIAIGAETGALEGKWEMVSATIGGHDATANEAGTFEIQGSGVKLTRVSGTAERYEIEAVGEPQLHRLLWKHLNKDGAVGRVSKALYSRDGDSLTIILDKDFPASIKGNQSDSAEIIRLKLLGK